MRQPNHMIDIPLRWRDHDIQNHVNNSLFMTFLEEARADLLHAIPGALDLGNAVPVLAETTLRFKKPAVWPGSVQVHTHFDSHSDKSITLSHKIFQGDTVVAEGRVTLVWVNPQSGRPTVLPESLITVIQESELAVAA